MNEYRVPELNVQILGERLQNPLVNGPTGSSLRAPDPLIEE